MGRKGPRLGWWSTVQLRALKVPHAGVTAKRKPCRADAPRTSGRRQFERLGRPSHSTSTLPQPSPRLAGVRGRSPSTPHRRGWRRSPRTSAAARERVEHLRRPALRADGTLGIPRRLDAPLVPFAASRSGRFCASPLTRSRPPGSDRLREHHRTSMPHPVHFCVVRWQALIHAQFPARTRSRRPVVAGAARDLDLAGRGGNAPPPLAQLDETSTLGRQRTSPRPPSSHDPTTSHFLYGALRQYWNPPL
jgi:hypothetical protein